MHICAPEVAQSRWQFVGQHTCSRSSSFIQASEPRVSVISADSSGLQNASHRRGVTPLVLFWNFSGKIFTKSCSSTACTGHQVLMLI